MDATLIGAAISILIILITIVIGSMIIFLITFAFINYRKSKVARRDVMLTGLSGSGKTLLFSQLIYNKAVNTQTSMEPNVGKFALEKGNLNIVDIPGYEKLREKFVSKYKDSSRAFIYVIDSLTITKEIRDAAEFLYVLLSDPTIASNCKNILIFCNKQDETMAKGMEVIRSQLEKELNLLRNTKACQLIGTDDKEYNTLFLGSPNCDFNFAQYFTNIELAQGYIYNKDKKPCTNYEPITRWLTKVS